METHRLPPRPTHLGLVASSLTAVAIATGLVLLSGPVLAAGLAAMLLILLCRYLAARHLEAFSIERDLPRRAVAGESFPMEIRVTAGPRFPPGHSLLLTDPLAPAVKERLLDPTSPSGRSLRCTGLATRRGPLPRRPWTLLSTWPLGLFLTESQSPFLDDHALLVHPKPWLPSRLRERLEQLAATTAERPLQPADPLAEFRLLREFRNGDPVRGIHWPSSLRSGRLQFAETEPPRPKPLRYGILLHSYDPPGAVVTPETYELVLRIATGLLLRFRREEIPVVFCQAPGPVSTLLGHRDFSARLDTLALSRRSPLTSLDALFGLAGSPETHPFRDCDEVFVLGDSSLDRWEETARSRFPRCTCLDSTSLTTGSRPGLLVRARTSA